MRRRITASALSISIVALFALSLSSLAPAATTRLPVGSPITGSGTTGVILHAPYGVGVDEATGNVFVADGTGGNYVAVYGAEGGLPTGVASPYKITGLAFAAEPTQVAVDNAATSPSLGTLYVGDVFRNKLKKYVRNPSTQLYELKGEFNPEPGVGVKEPKSVAVDGEGNVYAVSAPNEIFKFSPTGTVLAKYTKETGSAYSNMAIDAAGDVFVPTFHNSCCGGKVYKFRADGLEFPTGLGGVGDKINVPLEKGENPLADGVAVDMARNQLFVALTDRVLQFDATTLAKEGEFGMGVLEKATGIGVNSKTNRVYVSDAGTTKRVLVFGAEVPVPAATPNPASDIGSSSATLNGTVNPAGTAVTECKFEYLSEADFQENDPSGRSSPGEYGRFGPGPNVPLSKPCEGALPADSSDHSVSASISGLEAGETYHFRMRAANANGPYVSLQKTFETSSGTEVALTVEKTGTGSGAVTSEPAGIDCGATCVAQFEVGAKVTLTATPGESSTFAGWSGAGCSGTGSCEVTMTEAKTVTAEFTGSAKPKFALKVKLAGSGTGTVTSSPSGIDCGLDCEEEYEEGTAVTLAGAAGANSKAVVWSGCATVNGENKCEVTMSAAKEVTATFSLEQHQLEVKKTGTGTGKVSSSPPGIDCGSECSALYDHETAVTLTGTPGAKTKAVQWAGCDSVNGENKCLVTINTAKEVTATFDLEPPPKFALKVKLAGSGTGTVTSSPSGIDCGLDCEEEYEEGTAVTLAGAAGANSKAVVWSGCATVNGENKCEVTMSAAKEVTATFDEEAKGESFPLTVVVEGTGTGTVSSDKGAISCNPFCTDEYEAGTMVTLTATASPGSIFYSWRYCDSGGVNGRQCTVTIDKAKTVKATFTTTHDLEVSRAGTGLGKVQSSPGGILCLANCSETTAVFREATKVALKPTPTKHFHFVGWSGDCSGSGACEVTMGEDHAVSAEFAEDPKHVLSLTKSGGGQGTVKSSVAGINCGLVCSQQASAYYQGEVLELTATPSKGSAFKGWSGACTGTGACTVTMSEAREVVAEFG